jgi:uncharacterized protein (TIGR03083 family)
MLRHGTCTLRHVTADAAGQADSWLERGAASTAALAETWGSLAEVCHDLVAAEWLLPTECPGWSVQDQLSHLIGIERTLMGEAPPTWDAPLGSHVKNDFAAVNETWVAVRRELPGNDVLGEFREVTAQRLGDLGGLSADEWAKVGFSPVGQVPYVDFMDVRVFDSWVHEQDVRLALDRPGGGDSRASQIALDRVRGAMPFVVGKKAGAPDGAVVRFDLSGPGADALRFDVGVEGGRARLVPTEGEPTVTLSMSSVDFTRLGCGRTTSDVVEAAGGVAVEGDAALGRGILGVMNFMF